MSQRKGAVPIQTRYFPIPLSGSKKEDQTIFSSFAGLEIQSKSSSTENVSEVFSVEDLFL